MTKQEKKDLVFALQGKSRRECEKELVKIDPSAAFPCERERVVSSTQTEIRFVADDALMEKLKRIRELDSHVQSDPSYQELFHRMADLVLKKLDPAVPKTTQTQKIAISRQRLATPPAEEHTQRALRTIPAKLKSEVWQRDQGRCRFKSPDENECGSRFALEIDHIKPIAWSGKTEINNLQLLCRAHNQLKALSQLGPEVMSRYLESSIRN